MTIGTEKAFDVLPYVIDIYEKMNMDKYIKETRKNNKGKKVDSLEAGISLFKFVVKNLDKAKNEVFEVVAVLEDKTADEIKEQPLMKTIKSLKELFADEELVSLFKSAM